MKVFIKLADYIKEQGMTLLLIFLALIIWVYGKIFRGKEVNN